MTMGKDSPDALHQGAASGLDAMLQVPLMRRGRHDALNSRNVRQTLNVADFELSGGLQL